MQKLSFLSAYLKTLVEIEKSNYEGNPEVFF